MEHQAKLNEITYQFYIVLQVLQTVTSYKKFFFVLLFLMSFIIFYNFF